MPRRLGPTSRGCCSRPTRSGPRARAATRARRPSPRSTCTCPVGGRRPGSGPPSARAGVTARAAHLARDLANTPSNVKDPAWLAGQARDVGRRNGVDVTVRDEKELAAEGFGGILAVGSGSARPPRLVEMSYRPRGARRAGPHVVLVGKGITFDSGGLSLKPREAMVPMKTDMAAGGAVIAVMAALRDAGVRVRVTGLVAAAENMPGAGAMRPRDVDHALRRPDGRGLQHRRRGPAGAGRRARVRRRRARPGHRRRRRDPDRGSLAGPGSAARRALQRATRTSRVAARRRREQRRPAVADAAGRGLPSRDGLRHRGPVQHLPRPAHLRRVDHRGAVPARVRR